MLGIRKYLDALFTNEKKVTSIAQGLWGNVENVLYSRPYSVAESAVSDFCQYARQHRNNEKAHTIILGILRQGVRRLTDNAIEYLDDYGTKFSDNSHNLKNVMRYPRLLKAFRGMLSEKDDATGLKQAFNPDDTYNFAVRSFRQAIAAKDHTSLASMIYAFTEMRSAVKDVSEHAARFSEEQILPIAKILLEDHGVDLKRIYDPVYTSASRKLDYLRLMEAENRPDISEKLCQMMLIIQQPDIKLDGSHAAYKDTSPRLNIVFNRVTNSVSILEVDRGRYRGGCQWSVPELLTKWNNEVSGAYDMNDNWADPSSLVSKEKMLWVMAQLKEKAGGNDPVVAEMAKKVLEKPPVLQI